MEDNRQYLQIMIDSLQKKILILEDIADQNQLQTEIIKKDVPDWDEFDMCFTRKTNLIERLELLDDGFESMYNHVKDVLEKPESKNTYREEILLLQGLITRITEQSVAIQTSEMRNKQFMENKIAERRMHFKTGKVSSKAAMDYYKNMRQTNVITPQFLDSKK